MMPTDASPTAICAILLGTAQDGGVPQFGCRCDRCAAARADESRRRTATSLLVRHERTGFTLLIDPSPDLARQYDGLLANNAKYATRPAGAPLFNAIALTHVHFGHWTGLGLFGREVAATSGVPVHASPHVCDFLRAHAPASLAVELGHLSLEPYPAIGGGAPIAIGPLAVTPVAVPHRTEFGDTVAFVMRALEATRGGIFYCPDIDAWPPPGASPDLATIAATCDVAFVDATFGDANEVPGRDLSEVPHPVVAQTMAYFAPATRADTRVALVHLNHSNPLGDHASTLATKARAAGFEIPPDGATYALDGTKRP